MSFKSGFITIIGRPNVGKSTLINRLAGEKIAITSGKPQTTRNTIKAVVTSEDCQMIFIDTPGIHKPKTKLGEYMVNVAEGTLSEIDAVLFVIEATDTKPGAGDDYIINQLGKVKAPAFLVINKMDLVKKEQLLEVISNYKDTANYAGIIPVSASENQGVDIIVKELRKALPEGPKYFPDDMLTDQPERTLAAEVIRESILENVSEEVPHGVGVEVVSFKEREGKNIIDIQATIYCEKDTHKAILIGKQGSMLKKIGSSARVKMESLFATKIFLELWVKVKPDWRNNDNTIKMLGYK